jgi:hypothetical protein
MGKLLETRIFLDFLKAKGKPKLVTINYDDSADKAIRLMVENKYSQLPVIKKEKVVGVVSFESVATTLFNFLRSKLKPPSKFRIEDLMEKAPIFNSEDDLLNLLDTLANKSFVLVKSGNTVTDIITSYDALQYFRNCGEDFLVLNDIECILRKFIAEKFDASFWESAEKIFAFKKKQPKTINDMEFADYATFISSNWDRFNDLFKDKEDFMSYIEKARVIRNSLCHFNSPVGQADRDSLKSFLNWLENKIK